MGKFYKIIILSCFFALTSFSLYSQQINLIRFNNSASYTSGSGVSVIINPTGVFDLNNQFVLELSNPGGAFTTPTVLNTLNEFYVPVINGVLPNGLAAGTYTLRVRSTNSVPVTPLVTVPFSVVSGSGIGIPNFRSGINNDGSTKFNCLTDCSSIQSNNIYGQIDVAANNTTSILNNTELRGTICNFDTNATYQVNLINISNSTVTNLNLNAAAQFSIPNNLTIGSYIIEIEKKILNNISIFSNIFIFHGSATNINNLSSETVCVGNNVQFSIDATSNGIGRNYMGSKYTIDFGDGSPILTYTHAKLLQILSTTELISHTFNSVSCSIGTSPNIGYYIVKLKLFNKGVFNSGINANYCNQYYENGNGADKRVNTNRAPVADFILPNKQCINTGITATNNTVLGQYGTTNCLTTPRYYWYIKRPTDADFLAIDSSFNPSWLVGNNLVIPASFVNIPGCWQIKLEAQNAGAGCTTTTEMIKTIKIEAIPTPSFTNSPQSPICAGNSVLFTNTSNVLTISCQEPVYSWTVTPVSGTPATSTGYQFIVPSTASSPNANILFTQPGSYSVVLNVTNSCGTFASTPRIIEVFGDPTVSFNPNTLTICDAAPAGHTINFNQVSTTPTYSVAPYAPTNFTWTVSGPGVTSADYSFVGGTNANSQYPQINFTAYKTYIITVQVNGNCAGSNQASFTFILKEMPAISNSNLTQTICTGGTTSPINLTSSMASGTIFNWIVTATNGITGFTTPGNSGVIPATTLINPSNTSGTVTYTVTPSNNGCVGTPVNFVITVNPAPLVPTQTFIACSGNAFTVSLSNNPPSVILPSGTTFTWTVSSPVGITGASNQTTPVSSIGQTLVNTTNAPIDVIYTITASTGTVPSTCTSNFTLTVTVNPKPQIPNQTSSICSGNAFNLSLSNNPPSIILPSGTTYTWTVSAPAGITGASNQTNPVNTIGQTLLNSTSNPINVIYTITATSGSVVNTCTSNFNLTVTVNPAPSATISGNASVCQNSNAAVITFTGLNGVAPYTFSYSINGGSNQTISTTSGNSVTLIAATSILGTFNYCLLGVMDSSTSSCLNTSNSCVAVIVNSLPTISTQPTTTQSICLGGTIAPLTVAYTGGVGTATYQWYSNTTNSNSGGTLIAGATNSSYTPAAFSSAGTYYYYATITLSGNGCGNTTSNTAEVIVVTDPIVDTQALATQTLCQNSPPTNLTISVSGGIGTFAYQWYSNITNSTSGGTLIPGATNATFIPPTATVGTRYYYCVVTQSGVGCNVTSAVSQVIIVPAPAITTQPTSSSVCENGTPMQLTVAYTNGTGTPTYQWFSNTTNSTIGGTPISGATSASYSPPSTTVGTLYYYCEITFSSGGCTSVLSNTAEVVINPLPTVSTQPTTTQSICVGGTIAPLTVAYTGGVGTATYQWYSNTTNSNSGGTLIAGANNSSYTPAAFTSAGTYYYYATITLSGNGCGNTTSNTAEVIVVTDPIVDTQALATQTLCQNSPPTNLTISVSGGIGTFAYQWYSNITNSTSGGTLIPGATNATFIPPTATVGTRYYYCVVTQSGVGCNVTSAVSQVIIVPAPAITTEPASSSVCLNGTPTLLTVAYTNGTGTPTYQWFSNTTNSTIGGTPISGATSASYSPPSTTVGTLYYYCEITFFSGGCTSVLSNTAEVVINPLPTVSTQPTTTQSICVGGTIAPLTVAYTGGVGTATYQWYSNTTNSNSGGTLIAGATNSSYTPAAFSSAGTYYYYATITLSGNGCGNTTSNTAEVVVVTDPIVDTQAIATQTLCQSSTPTDLTISVSSGIGTISYQWYSNTTNSTTGGVLITGATNNTYTPTATTVGTQYYYCVVTQSGVGCNVTSAVSQVIIVAAPAISTQPASSSVCENGTPTQLTVAFTNGTGTPTYQWFSNTSNNAISGTAISGATSVSYNPPSTTVGTLYYYCEITFSSGGCTSVLSNTAEVVINPLPTVSTQPTTTQSICVGGTIAPLTVAYTDGVGTATYQWYSNNTNTNSGGTLIAGATNSSYTPAAFSSAGTYYFYATITLSGNGCGNTTSNTAQVVVVADPIVNTQAITTQTLCQSSTPTDLTISVSGGIGTFVYQWFSNTTNSNSGGTLIAGATNSSYTPNTAIVSTQYYYCLVTQSGVGCNVTSAVSTIIVVPAPAITTEPASSSVCENGTPTQLTVAYSNGTGTPTYQWFCNTIGGTPISGATSASYSPPSTTVGTLYYYCEITFSSGGCTSVFSNTAQVVINPLPTVSTQPTTTQSICVGGTIAPLTVAYTGGVGTATYQWYSNNTNTNSGGTLITGATNSSYTPAAFTSAGTYYYYTTITLSGNGCGSTTSNTAEVVVVADPIVNTQAITTQTLCQSSAPTDLTISVSGGIGTLAYQWYSNSTNGTTGGTLIPGATNATFIPSTATVGTQYYYCVVTQSGVGCNVTSAVSQVIIVAAPAITTQPASSSVCLNGTPTLLTVAFTNGTGTPTYQWFSNTTNSTIGGNAIAGATAISYNPPAAAVGTLYYYCEITFSSGGCSSVLSNTAEVVINQIPVVNNVVAIICSDEQYIFNSTNSNDVLPAGLQYSWNLLSMTPTGTVSGSVNNGTLQNQFIQQLVNNSNGITTLVYEVTPIAGICTGNPFTITIEVYPRPDVTFDLPIQTICNETNTSLVTLNSSLPGNITYNWTATIPTGITGALSSGANTIPVQTLINTTNTPLTITYSATATFNNNGSSCEGNVYTNSITVNPTFTSSGVVSNYNGYNVSVFGANDGSINLTTVGGSGTYTYSWTGPNGYTSTNEDVSGLFAGTYTVTINDGYCAPIILTFTLTQPPELLIQPDLNLTINLICFGNNNGAVGVLITQESVPPYDYELYNSSGNLVTSIINSTNLNPQFTGLVAGIYSLTVIDANGGRKTVTGLTVTQPNDIVITATTTPITCYGANNASITLTVTGGTGPYQAQWDNLATGFYQNNLAAGNYSILVTDNNGCTKTIVVNIPEAPIFSINPVVVNISCYGANDGSINLNLVGGIQPISLTWSDGSTAGLVRNNLVAGTYTVTIIDSKPCTIVRTFIIVEPQPLVLSANIQNALDCNNANSGAINLLVSGGTPPFTYSWTNGTTTEDLINIPSGNYAVVVTDSRGCTKTAQYSVNRPQPLTLNVETDTNVNCETREISQIFEAQVSGGVPPIQLNWSSGTVSGSNNEFMTTNQDGLVVLTATDALGCTTTYSLNVDIPVLGNASFNQTSNGYTAYGIYSILDPIQFTNTATGDYVSILWNFGDGTFSNEENPIHTYVLEGDYVVTQTVTYPFGCVYVHTISLLVEKGYLLVVPTAFTPNNDSLNDTYRPVTKGLKNVRLTIYDTWGSLIYSETGDVLRGWDGTIKGVNAENGNYHCKVSADTFYGSIIEAEETFVLIK